VGDARPDHHYLPRRSGGQVPQLPPVNGRSGSAEDVRYMIERFKTTTLPTLPSRDFQGINVEVVDPKTARFKFDAPMASFWTKIVTAGLSC